MNRPIAAARVLVWSMLALAASLPAYAQNFPDRPVHLIIPYGPGGITDFAGRVLAQKIGDALGQTVVAENKPGAGGIVGVDYVAHSAPDGYNMAVMDPARRRQSDAAENDALRHFQGYRAALDHELVAGSFGGRAAARHQDLRRAGRLRQSQSGQAQLCQRRRRHHAASRRRNVEIAHRHRRRARAL